MATIKELIRTEANNTISFGDYERAEKGKKEDYEFKGNKYKVKTFSEMTKLERDEMFVYESVPGTSVSNFDMNKDGVSFAVSGYKDAQIIVGLEEDTEYDVTVAGKSIGKLKTNLSGKLDFSVELSADEVQVTITK